MFKVGDRVRVKSSYLVADMMRYIGKESAICEAYINGTYALDIDGEYFFWSDKMLEKVETGGNEMTALEYFEIKKRMTKSKSMEGGCNIPCIVCGLCSEKNGTDINCREFEIEHPKQAIEIVRKWGEEHPVKTYLSDFLKKYPKAQLDGGIPAFCPYEVGYFEKYNSQDKNCAKCWNQPYEEGERNER